MIKKSVLVSKSVIDFLYMFFSNIIKKGFGLLREVILAYLFGSSIVYANFILLRTITQLLSQFTDGNALQANLLPKFSKIYSEYSEVSLQQVFSFSKKTMYLLFFVSFLSQIPVLYYINPEKLTFFICISILLSEKKQIISQTEILEYWSVNEKITNIGGVSNLKDWLKKRKNQLAKLPKLMNQNEFQCLKTKSFGYSYL